MAPVFELISFEVDAQLLHSPDKVHSEVPEWVQFAEGHSGFGEELQNLVLNLYWRGQWIPVRITDSLVMQRYEAEHEHVFRQQEVVKAEQCRWHEQLQVS